MTCDTLSMSHFSQTSAGPSRPPHCPCTRGLYKNTFSFTNWPKSLSGVIMYLKTLFGRPGGQRANDVIGLVPIHFKMGMLKPLLSPSLWGCHSECLQGFPAGWLCILQNFIPKGGAAVSKQTAICVGFCFCSTSSSVLETQRHGGVPSFELMRGFW